MWSNPGERSFRHPSFRFDDDADGSSNGDDGGVEWLLCVRAKMYWS